MLPKAEQQLDEWLTAISTLIMAADDRGPLVHARIGMLRALNHIGRRIILMMLLIAALAANCGFYPGSGPGECIHGTSVTFDAARADFEQAWAVFLSNRTKADFQEWRDDRDWRAWKYSMWARGEKLPSQKPNSMMRCPCGERFDSHDPAGNYDHRGHIYAAQAADGIRR